LSRAGEEEEEGGREEEEEVPKVTGAQTSLTQLLVRIC
jgi:hypothetical protein